MVGVNEICVGGNIGANIEGSGTVEFTIKDITFDFSEHAVVKLISQV